MTAEPQPDEPVESGPQLRLFTPPPASDDGGSSTPDSMTLGQLFETQFVLLWIRGKNLDGKTETAYRESLSWWRRLTGDPPLWQIDDFTVARFVSELCTQAGRRGEQLSSWTVKRHCTNIQKLLSFAGPKGREKHSRKNRGLLPDPPYVESPETDKPAPHGYFTLSQIHSLYRAASAMNRPNHILGVEPAWWWRGIIVVGYYTGLRREQLLDLEYARLMIGVGNGSITVLPRRGKRKCGFTRYLPAVALEHIKRIRTPREFIFEWRVCPRQLSHHFDKLLRAAGLPDRCGTGDKFHGLRKTHTTMLAALDPEQTLRIAQCSAGHSDLAVTLDHYVAGAVQDLVQARAIDALPSPVPSDFVDRHERQQLLF